MSNTRNNIEENLFGDEINRIPDENHIRALYDGYSIWKNKNITYCFNKIPTVTSGPDSLEMSVLSESMQSQVKKSFEAWSQFSQLSFHQDENNGKIKSPNTVYHVAFQSFLQGSMGKKTYPSITARIKRDTNRGSAKNMQ